MIAKGSVGGINTDPAATWQEHLNPGMEKAFGPAIGHIDLKIAKKPADQPDRESLFPHDRGTEQRGIAAGAGTKLKSSGRQPRVSVFAHFIRDLVVEKLRQFD